MKSNLIHAALLLFFSSSLGINIASAEEYSTKEIDKAVILAKKILPMKILPTLTFESMKRDDKTIYQIFKFGDMCDYTFNQDYITKVKDKILPGFSNLEFQKKTINEGYTYIFVYNTPEKEDIFRVVADKNTCSKFW